MLLIACYYQRMYRHRSIVSVVALLQLLLNSASSPFSPASFKLSPPALFFTPFMLYTLHFYMDGHKRMGAGLPDWSFSNVLNILMCFQLTWSTDRELFKMPHVFTVCLRVHKPDLYFLMYCSSNPFSVVVVSELTALWFKRRFVGWRLVEASWCLAVALSISATWLIKYPAV